MLVHLHVHPFGYHYAKKVIGINQDKANKMDLNATHGCKILETCEDSSYFNLAACVDHFTFW